MGVALSKDNSSLRGHNWATVALFVFTANAPDLDFIPGLMAGQPFGFHRLVTHSVAFVALSTFLVYAAMRVLKRPLPGRIARAVAMGLLSHIALDYFCGGPSEGVALLWPLSDVRVNCDFRIFPGLSAHPVLGIRNLEVALIEISFMMILFQISALHRLGRLSLRKPRMVRRATDGKIPADLKTAED